MPAHQIRIEMRLLASLLGCLVLFAIGTTGGSQAPTLVPAGFELIDVDPERAVDVAVDRAMAVAGTVNPLGDPWAMMSDQAVGLGRDLTHELAPALTLDRPFGNPVGSVVADLVSVERFAAATRSKLLDSVRVRALALTDEVRVQADLVRTEVADTGPMALTAPVSEPPPVAARVVVASPTERGHAALAPMPVQPSELGFTIAFLEPRPGFRGLTFPFRRHIEVYISSTWTDRELAHVIAHEIGHAVDVARNGASDHERWRAARGIDPSIGWWADAYASDFETPGGDFAECYAAWVVGVPASPTTPFGSCAGTGGLMQELVYG